MATVRVRGNVYYIQWYDPLKGKVTCKSTGLAVNADNRRLARKYANKLQQELTIRFEELKKKAAQGISIKEAFEHFLRNNQGKHPKTIKDYHRFYKKFTEHFSENLPCVEVTKLRVEEWLNKIKKLPLEKNSIHGFGKQCYHFLNFLFEYEYTPMFKINREVKTRPEIKEKIIFTDADIEKIFKGLGSKNINFQTAIYVMFYTGLRSSDVLSFEKGKIDLKNLTISYYSPKRKKYREVPFHSNLLKLLSSQIGEESWGKLLGYKTVEILGRAISRYLTEIGIGGKGYSARTFRKTFITLSRSRFMMDASVLRELVGHEQGNTTDRYYNQIQINTMRKELKKFAFKY